MSTAELSTVEQAAQWMTTEPSPYAARRERFGDLELSVFTHGPRTLRELYAASERHAERVFLVYEEERYTFAQIREQIASLGHALVHDFAIAKGDRVALAMRNYPEWCVAYAAVTGIGAVIVPLNAWWTLPELRYGLGDCGAKALIVDQERFDRVAPALSELGLRVIVARPSAPLPSGVVELASLLASGRTLPDLGVRPEDDATLMYTSGSTGHPKGVLSTQLAVTSSVFAWETIAVARSLVEQPEPIAALLRAWIRRGVESLHKPPFEMPQRSSLITLPLFHVTGCNVQFLPAFRGGRKLVMMRKWSPERALELIEREQITDFSGVPTMSWELINSPELGKRNTSTLLSLSAGGAARPPDQVKALKSKAPQAAPGAGYGMTETNSLGCAITGDDYLARPASTGRPMPPLVEMKVIGPDGAPLGVDQEGELCIKSVANMRGYWNREQETASTLVDGYVHTGDLGRIDADGFVYITGRAKDIVIRGGENISCPEVELALYEHPAVFEVAVYGVPDARLGEALAATVMLRAGAEATPEQLQAHVAERLAAFKVPAHVFVQRESLPRGATGKIDKRGIKKAAEARLQGGTR